MNKELLELYKKVSLLPNTKEIEIVKDEIEATLSKEMQEHILKITSIGSVIGYDKVKAYLNSALDMVEVYDRGSNKGA